MSALDHYITRDTRFENIIKEINTYMKNDCKEEALEALKRMITLYNRVNLRNDLSYRLKVYYSDQIDIYWQEITGEHRSTQTPLNFR